MFELPPLAGWPSQANLIREPDLQSGRKSKRKGRKSKRLIKKNTRKRGGI